MITKFQTTFWSDFSIADAFGTDAIQDTYNRAFSEWKTNYIYLTELVVVLNWKLWQWYEKKDDAKSQLYERLFREAEDFALNNLKGEELTYYFNITD